MKTIKYTAYGAITGFCIGLVLALFVGCDAVCSCTGDWFNSFLGCGDATCASGCEEFTSDPVVRNCVFYSTVVCAVIGGAYGAFQTLQDKDAARKAAELQQSESAKKQRVKWASEIKEMALNANHTCFKNQLNDQPVVNATYRANTYMTEIIDAVAKAEQEQGKVDSLVDELCKKGGTSI